MRHVIPEKITVTVFFRVKSFSAGKQFIISFRGDECGAENIAVRRHAGHVLQTVFIIGAGTDTGNGIVGTGNLYVIAYGKFMGGSINPFHYNFSREISRSTLFQIHQIKRFPVFHNTES